MSVKLGNDVVLCLPFYFILILYLSVYLVTWNKYKHL